MLSSVEELLKALTINIIDFIKETHFHHRLQCLLCSFRISYIALVLHFIFTICYLSSDLLFYCSPTPTFSWH